MMRYAKRVQADINNSVMDNPVFSDDVKDVVDTGFTYKDTAVVLMLFAGFGVFVYGAFKYKWDVNNLNGIMMLVAFASAALFRFKPQKVVDSFIHGSKEILYAALITGLASSITVILTDGNIIHTIIRALSEPLTKVGPTASVFLMYGVNLLLNFFIPSSSGMAVLTMPIMAPLADIIGVSRQMAVLMYQFGDAYANSVIPLSGVLMGYLGIAKVKFDEWLKFMFPLFLIWSVISVAAVFIGLHIGF